LKHLSHHKYKMYKILVIALTICAVFGQNSTCLPNQYWDPNAKVCTNEVGTCKPVGS